MKIKIAVGVLFFLIILNLATIGSFVYFRFFQEPEDQIDFPSRRRPLEPPFEGGDVPAHWLRPEEREQLRGLIHDFRLDTQELKMNIHDLEEEIFELMSRDSLPTGEIDSLLEEMSAIRLRISRKAVEKLIHAKSVLSPDQLELFYGAILRVRPEPHGALPPFHKGPPPPPVGQPDPENIFRP